VFFEPKILKGEGIIQDPTTGETVSPDDLRKTFREQLAIVSFLNELENGLIQMTFQDYLKMPAAFSQMRAIYLDMKLQCTPKR